MVAFFTASKPRETPRQGHTSTDSWLLDARTKLRGSYNRREADVMCKMPSVQKDDGHGVQGIPLLSTARSRARDEQGESTTSRW